MSKLKCQN